MIPIILSGGTGQRLWPISRTHSPKQFCQFLSSPLLEQTLERISSLEPAIIVSNINLKIPTENIVNRFQTPIDIIYEPISRNTAPAIALVCKYLQDKKKSDEWVCILPADHVIKNEELLLRALKTISTQADDSIYLIGINPTEAKTGYGYIEIDNKPNQAIFSVKNFHEKPNKKLAETYIHNKSYLWNSGIFVFKPSMLIDYFKASNSTIWNAVKNIDDFEHFVSIYEALTSISFDIEVLEKFKSIKCIPLELEWSDVGSWDEFARVIPQEVSFDGEIINYNSSNNYFVSNDKKVISTIGVQDILVIDSPDSLLLCKKGESEHVKTVVSSIQNECVINKHNLELKPWGYFKVLSDEDHCKVKKICIFSNHQISYQSHIKRDEHWVVVKGSGTVVIDDLKKNIKLGDSLFIKKEQKHRVSNTGENDLELIEVQVGEYFGEDDIIRYKDDYGRID